MYVYNSKFPSSPFTGRYAGFPSMNTKFKYKYIGEKCGGVDGIELYEWYLNDFTIKK